MVEIVVWGVFWAPLWVKLTTVFTIRMRDFKQDCFLNILITILNTMKLFELVEVEHSPAEVEHCPIQWNIVPLEQ